MYRVVNSFSDLEDGGFVYMAGDVFPRHGKNVSEERLTELATTQNKRGVVLIESVSEEADKSSEEAEKPAEKKRKKKNAGADSENHKKLLHS